jgi:hypothetical protein
VCDLFKEPHSLISSPFQQHHTSTIVGSLQSYTILLSFAKNDKIELSMAPSKDDQASLDFVLSLLSQSTLTTNYHATAMITNISSANEAYAEYLTS